MAPKKQPVKGGHGVHKSFSNRSDHIACGEVLVDQRGKKWRLGKPIGSGGFGDIYLAHDEISRPVTDKAAHVIKIEPYTNGPLFVEIAFYLRAAKPELIEDWKRDHKLEPLGMPEYVASGRHDYRSNKYRFLVLPRYGQDLQKMLEEKPGKRFGLRTVLAIALQIMDVYEYIHSKKFVHADLKSSNLVLEYSNSPKKKSASKQVFLLDYGLALRYVDANDCHIQYGPDARIAHNGTLEYASRDAHIGAFSRRGDLEVLGYNMLEWLCGKLPWNAEDPPEYTHKQKQALMTDINLRKIYPAEIHGLDIIEKFLKYVSKLPFDEKPNYAHCRDILKKGLPNSHKGSLYLDDLGVGVSCVKSSKTAKKRKAEDIIEHIIAKKICVPLVEEEEQHNPKRSTRTTKKVKDFNWARVLSMDPEKIVRAAASLTQQAVGGKNEAESRQSPIITNPTPAMLQILSKRKENIRSPFRTKILLPTKGTNELTPAMREVLVKKRKIATNIVASSKLRPGPTANTRSRRHVT